MWAAACVLVVAGVSQAAAQFPPPPGQSQSQSQSQANPGGVFPPPPGSQPQSSPFPAPPAPNQGAQSSAFPPPSAPGRATGISIAPSGGGSFAAPNPGGGFSAPPRQPSEEQKVCMTFPSIREEVEKGGAAIRAAADRKATREEVCPLFKNFAAREGKMLHFMQTNQKLCGVPPNIIKQLKTAHAKTIQIRNNVCSTAPVASAPTLSDALGGPIIADDSSAKLPNRGTFDTLTGNALQR
jgi:hypothetical protein